MNIERRIEKAAGIEREPEMVPVLIIGEDESADETLPPYLGPVGKWMTLRTSLEEARQLRQPCVFVGDPFAEYEARHGLTPGTLTEHELRGKVPFAELLAVAAGQAPEQEGEP